MADEEAVATPTEQATPAIETVATPTETPSTPVDEPEYLPGPDEIQAIPQDADGNPLAPVEPAEIDDDLEDIEWNGKTFKAPKGVKDGILMQSDYTKKTQAAAERQKALDAREAQIAQQADVTEDELRDRAVMLSVSQQLSQYENVDWVALHRQDPVGYGEHHARYMQLQQAAQETAASLNAKQTERTQHAERDLATRVEETLKFASEKIPGFKPELIGTLVQFAESVGIPEEAIKSNWSPKFLNLLRMAHIGNLTLQKQTAAPPTRLLSPPLAPLATVGGKSAPATSADLQSSDMASYVAARKKGVGGKPAF